MRIAVWAVCLFTAVSTLLPVIPTDNWWVRIFVFPRPQLTGLLALAILALGCCSTEGAPRRACCSRQ